MGRGLAAGSVSGTGPGTELPDEHCEIHNPWPHQLAVCLAQSQRGAFSKAEISHLLGPREDTNARITLILT